MQEEDKPDNVITREGSHRWKIFKDVNSGDGNTGARLHGNNKQDKGKLIHLLQ